MLVVPRLLGLILEVAFINQKLLPAIFGIEASLFFRLVPGRNTAMQRNFNDSLLGITSNII